MRKKLSINTQLYSTEQGGHMQNLSYPFVNGQLKFKYKETSEKFIKCCILNFWRIKCCRYLVVEIKRHTLAQDFIQ